MKNFFLAIAICIVCVGTAYCQERPQRQLYRSWQYAPMPYSTPPGTITMQDGTVWRWVGSTLYRVWPPMQERTWIYDRNGNMRGWMVYGDNAQ